MSCFKRWKWSIGVGLTLVAFVVFRVLAAEGESLPIVNMKAGDGWFVAEVASTDKQMAQGLMYRQSLDEHSGMLFPFTSTNKHCLWMRNTLIPLSVAWLDADGVILEIQDMEPKTDTRYCSSKPASFALEVNKGAFERQGIVVGMQFL